MKSVKIPHYLYTASLFFLIFLTAVCVAVSGADVIIQALTDKTSNGQFDPRNLLVVSSSYVLLALASLLFSCSRMLTVRNSLQDIPKLYIPIKKEDLPRKVFLKIQQAFERARETRSLAEPRIEDIQVVGRAIGPATKKHTSSSNRHSYSGNNGGGDSEDDDEDIVVIIPPEYEGLDFRQIIGRTPGLFQQHLPDFPRAPNDTVVSYIRRLVDSGLVDAGLAEQYLKSYQKARFSDQPLTPKEYMKTMKNLVLIFRRFEEEFGTMAVEDEDSNSQYQRRLSITTSGRPMLMKVDSTATSSILSSFSNMSVFVNDDEEERRGGDGRHETSLTAQQQQHGMGIKGPSEQPHLDSRRPRQSSAATSAITTSKIANTGPRMPRPSQQHRNSTASNSSISHRKSGYGGRKSSSSHHYFLEDDARSWMSRSTYHTYTSQSSAGGRSSCTQQHPNWYHSHRRNTPPVQQQQQARQARKRSVQRRPVSHGDSSSVNSANSMLSVDNKLITGPLANSSGSQQQLLQGSSSSGGAGAGARRVDVQKARSLRTTKAMHSRPPDRVEQDETENDSSINIITDEEDDYSIYDEDEVRQDIYEILMKDKASQPQLP